MPKQEPNKHPGPGPHMGGSQGSFSSSGSYGPGPYSQRGPYSQPNTYATHRKSKEDEVKKNKPNENRSSESLKHGSDKIAKDFDSDEQARWTYEQDKPGEVPPQDQERIPPEPEW